MRIVVTGSEGSGTNYVGRVLTGHPQSTGFLREWDGRSDIEEGITHISIPHGLGLTPRWVEPEQLRGCRLVIVRRNLLDSTYSAYRRFYRQGAGRTALDHQLLAGQLLSRIRRFLGAEGHIDVEYEMFGQGEWKPVFDFLGWDDSQRPSEQFVRRNGRYLADEAFLQRVAIHRLVPSRLGRFTFGRRPVRAHAKA